MKSKTFGWGWGHSSIPVFSSTCCYWTYWTTAKAKDWEIFARFCKWWLQICIYIYIRVRDVLNKYRSSCVLADEYSAGIKSRGLHFQSCYFVKGPMNSLDLCQFRYCLPPEARRSAVEKLLARAEDQHAKSRNGTGGWPGGEAPWTGM